MIDINKYELSTTGIDACKGKLVPGIVATWGEIVGDVTKQEDLIDWVEGQGYLTEHQPIKTVNHQSLIGEGDIEIEAVVPDYYATKQWVEDQGYLTEHQSLEGYATEDWVEGQGYLVQDDLSQYATRQWVVGRGYITSSALEGYATESWVSSQGYLTSVPSGYATEQWVGQQGYITTSALSGYATESWVENKGYYQLSPGWYPVENRDILNDPYVEDVPEDYPLVEYIGLSPMTIGYCDIGETWRFDGVRLDYNGAGIYTITPVETEVEGETVIEYQEEYKSFALEEDLTSLTSRVSTLETNYGDAVTTTNNILGV